MREIKYRAWDKITKKMYKVSSIHIEDEYVVLFEKTIYEGEFKRKFSEIILMQYTGLKDKNGVEIYEGDIVNVTFEGSHFFNSEVKWFGDKGYPSFDIEAPRTFYFDSNVLSCISNVSEYEIEVIGNKFDNPELLD